MSNSTTVATVTKLIGYEFRNPEYAVQAVQAAGRVASITTVRGDNDGNKKLALLGDAVLQVLVLDDWFQSGNSRAEGHKKNRTLGSNAFLARLAQDLGIEPYIEQNPAEGAPSKSTLASTIEALLGAVWIDSNRNINEVKRVAEYISIFQGKQN